jgi:hypothetical protein
MDFVTVRAQKNRVAITFHSKPSNMSCEEIKVCSPPLALHGELDHNDQSDFHPPNLMDSNPNTFFYRNVAPGETHRTGAWTPEEKRLFLEAFERDPPLAETWGLFAAHIPGRVGYQCRHFYRCLVESGELKPHPGLDPKRLPPEVPVPESETEVRQTVKWSPRMKEPWLTLKGKSSRQSIETFEYEASKLLKANMESPLNMILFDPPGGATSTEEYFTAIKNHLMSDTQEEKDRLLCEYFKVRQAPDSLQADLRKRFVEFVVQSVH